MKLGKFLKDCSGDIHGRICAFGIPPTSITFEPHKSKDGKPYFRIIANPLGEAYDVGAAFERLKDGMIYYTVTLESPVFADTVNAVLFPDRAVPGIFNLFWERPEQLETKIELTENGDQPARKFRGQVASL